MTVSCPWHPGDTASSFQIKSGPNQGRTGYSCTKNRNPEGPADKNPKYCGWKLYPGQPGYPAPEQPQTAREAIAGQFRPRSPAPAETAPTGTVGPRRTAADLIYGTEALQASAALHFASRLFQGSGNYVDALLAANVALAWLRNPGAPIEVTDPDGDIRF